MREEELLGHDSFYEPLLENGAHYVQYRDYESGIKILESLVHKKPFPADLAQELGDNKPLSDTAAGKAINADLAEAEAKYKVEMQKLCEEMKTAKERDREEIRANIQANNDECRALEAKKNKLANDQRNQTRDMANRLEEMLKQQEAKLAAVQAQHERTQQKMFRRQEAKLSAV